MKTWCKEKKKVNPRFIAVIIENSSCLNDAGQLRSYRSYGIEVKVDGNWFQQKYDETNFKRLYTLCSDEENEMLNAVEIYNL